MTVDIYHFQANFLVQTLTDERLTCIVFAKLNLYLKSLMYIPKSLDYIYIYIYKYIKSKLYIYIYYIYIYMYILIRRPT